MSNTISLVIAGGEMSMCVVDGKATYTPGISGNEMLSWLSPELAATAHVTEWSHQASSHYTVRMTTDLVSLLTQQVSGGAQAVIVCCGTDTIEEIAYLTDLLWPYPQPVIFAGSHDASDRLGSDAKAVLHEAFLAAASRECWGKGVLVCVEGLLFAASDLIETSNYRRSGYAGIQRGPVGDIIDDKVRVWQTPQRCKAFDPASVEPARNVELINAALGAGELLLAGLVDRVQNLDGLVLAGFGGGNVYPGWISSIRTLLRADVPVLLVSRCLQGRIIEHTDFEGSYMRLKEMGVLDGGSMNPLKARIKMSIGIGAGLRGEDLQEYLNS